MSDIALPRVVGLHIRNSLRGIVNASDDDCGEEKCPECAPVRVVRTALAALDAALAEPESKTPAWWMDGLTATLMREGVNKHRAREIAVGYWEAYCQIPGNKEDMT